VAFSQRLPAGIHNIHTEPGWAEFAPVLVSLSAAVTAQVTGRWPTSWRPPWPTGG
jgi:hypothetical protein